MVSSVLNINASEQVRRTMGVSFDGSECDACPTAKVDTINGVASAESLAFALVVAMYEPTYHVSKRYKFELVAVPCLLQQRVFADYSDK